MKLIPMMAFTVGALFSFQVQAANGVSGQLPIDQSDIERLRERHKKQHELLPNW
jgi:hypothetical protein